MKKTLLFLIGSCLVGLSQGDLFCEGDKIETSKTYKPSIFQYFVAGLQIYSVSGLFTSTIAAKNEKRDASPTSVDRVESLTNCGKGQQISKGVLNRNSSSKGVNSNSCLTPKCSNGNLSEASDSNDSMNCPTPFSAKLTVVIVPSLAGLYCASHPTPPVDVVSRSRTNSDEYGQLCELPSCAASPVTPKQRKQLENQKSNIGLSSNKYSKGSNLELQGIHGCNSPYKLSNKSCGTPVVTRPPSK